MDARAEGPRAGRVALLFALAGLLLYLPRIGWGLPSATAEGRHFTLATDEVLPLGPLAEMHNTFVVSKPDRNYAYPWLGYALFAAAQAPYLVWLKATGGLAEPRPEYPYGLADPACALRGLTLSGRALSALMGAICVAATYLFARELFGGGVALVAGLLALTGFRLTYYAGTGNLDVPAACFATLGLWTFAAIAARGFSVRRALALGAWAGLAMATKDQTVVVFLPLGLLLLLPRFSPRLFSGDGRWSARPALSALGAALAAYAAGTGMVLDPARHLEHVRRLLFDSASLTAAFEYWPRAPRTAQGALLLLAELARDFARTTTLPVALLALFGFVLAVRGPRWHAVWPFPFALLYLLLALPLGFVMQRYFLPLDPIVDALAALALATLWRAGGRAPRLLAALLGALALGLRLAVVADLAHAQLHETRALAGRWISAHARAGERVEFFGHPQQMPPLEARIVSRRVLGRERWQGETGHGPAVLAYLAREGPEYLAVIPDWTSSGGLERSRDCPPEVWAALLDGSAGYALAAFFPPPRLLPAWLRPELDSPAVAPPVRLFARADVARRSGGARPAEGGR